MALKAKSHFFVLGPAIAIIAVCSYLLINDIEKQGPNESHNAIGKLAKFDGKIYYKPKGAFSATEIQSGHLLFQGDLIITSHESIAVIEMIDGRKLQLQADTSVTLDQNSDLETKSINGAVLLQSTNGEERVLTGEQIVGGVSNHYNVRLIAPDELSEFFFLKDNPKTEINLKWQLVGDISNKPAFVEVAQSSIFQSAGKKEWPIPKSNTNQISISLPEGKFFWRIVDADHRTLSFYRQFRISKTSPLLPLSPSGETTVWGDNFDFQWTLPDDISTDFGIQWIEISNYEDFRSLTSKKPISAKAQHANISDLADGHYFWRIVSQYANLTVNSRGQEFDIYRGREFSVVDMKPADFAVLDDSVDPIFSWASPAVGAHYQIEIATSDGKSIKRMDSKLTQASVGRFKSGRYRWHVLASLGAIKTESKWVNFSVVTAGGVDLLRPTLNERVQTTDENSPIQFSWSETSRMPGSYYVIEIADEPYFKTALAKKNVRVNQTDSSDFNLHLNQVYFWRVSVRDSSGFAVKSSSVGEFKIQLDNGLAAPTDLLPQNGATCNPIATKAPCRFTWASLVGAQGYEIQFYEAEENGRMPAGKDVSLARPILTANTRDNFYMLKNLKEGDYFWAVRGKDAKGKWGIRSSTFRFKYALGAPLAAPKPHNAEVQ